MTSELEHSEFTLGLERCAAERPAMLEGARFGLLMNRASVDRDLRFACDVLSDAYPGQLAALLTPQHGLWGDAQANMIETDHGWHSRLNIPIYSLYSATRTPTAEMLAGLDCFVIDLQDVGTRVYTFVWTMLECLQACAAADVPVLVLDRPNPIGGRLVEGPMLDLAFRSFVGGASIPMRHGLTIGELARLLNSEQAIGATLEVVPLENWSPSQSFASLGRAWIPPSPNLPRIESALVYPGQVLLEGTNLSEGRGTTTPFEVTGAPFIDAEVFCVDLNARRLPGVRFLPLAFRPTFDKWAGKTCQGVSIHVTDRDAYRPYRTTVELLAVVQQHWPQRFEWLDPPYEYETELRPIDIISGSENLRTSLEREDQSLLESISSCPLASWQERVSAVVLYGTSNLRLVS
ncbi:MAG TPA: DUF1343 domain-containing protein [Pirellulaceae bacterium]|nr:DUF1343 domain-containing protein [Pirellulaceae bacterium]